MLWIVVVIAAIVMVGAIVALASYASGRTRRAPGGAPEVATRPRPVVAAFHVRGEDALVTFDVPLPSGEPDQVLTDLLVHEAVEVTREKRHELPIDQVTHVVALGRRNGDPAEVGRVTLSTPGQLPPPAPPEMVLHASRITFDPLASYHETAAESAPGLAEPTVEKMLPTIGRELRLASTVEAGLRAQGLDPAELGAGDLAIGLMRMSGYTVAARDKEGTYTASKGGARTYLRIVGHEPGSYPELDGKIIAEFMVDFVGSGADRGLLVTDKYGPFEVYDRERREPRVRFVVRERLQHFVDAHAVS